MPRSAGKYRATRQPRRPAALTTVAADRPAAVAGGELPFSPRGMAHFAACLHKGEHLDYSAWALLSEPRAWERLANGELPPATGGQRPSLEPGSTTASNVPAKRPDAHPAVISIRNRRRA